jgi:hypothetical protein
LDASLTFEQQIWLQLVGPVAAAVMGTLIIGGAAQLITTHAQRRSEDRKFRESLVGRISETAYSMHYRLEHFARWARHRNPPAYLRARAEAELELVFLNDRVALGALQNEIDVYFGPGGPGQALHRLADLVMVRFMQVTDAPESQQLELQASVAGPGHTNLSIGQLSDVDLVRSNIADALAHTLDEVMRCPLDRGSGFLSSKILTGPDLCALDRTAENVG